MPREGPRENQCQDCGFLALAFRAHPHHGNVELFELSDYARRTGEIGSVLLDNVRPISQSAELTCVRGVVDIQTELDQAYKDARDDPRVGIDSDRKRVVSLDVISKKRPCAEWKRHIEGLGPREHLGLRILEDLKSMERDWQLRMEESRKRYEEEVRRSNREHEEQTRRNARRFELMLAGVFIVVAIVDITINVVATVMTS